MANKLGWGIGGLVLGGLLGVGAKIGWDKYMDRDNDNSDRSVPEAPRNDSDDD